jgi:hypothetical protein
MKPALILERELKNVLGPLLIAAYDEVFKIKFNSRTLEAIKAGLEVVG